MRAAPALSLLALVTSTAPQGCSISGRWASRVCRQAAGGFFVGMSGFGVHVRCVCRLILVLVSWSDLGGLVRAAGAWCCVVFEGAPCDELLVTMPGVLQRLVASARFASANRFVSLQLHG